MKYPMTEASVARFMTEGAIQDKKEQELAELKDFITENIDLFKRLDDEVKKASKKGSARENPRPTPEKKGIFN